MRQRKGLSKINLYLFHEIIELHLKVDAFVSYSSYDHLLYIKNTFYLGWETRYVL